MEWRTLTIPSSLLFLRAHLVTSFAVKPEFQTSAFTLLVGYRESSLFRVRDTDLLA